MPPTSRVIPATMPRVAAFSAMNAAVALATTKAAELGAGGKLPKARNLKVRDRNVEAVLGFARTMVQATYANYPAPGKCLDAIEAADLSGVVRVRDEVTPDDVAGVARRADEVLAMLEALR